MLGRDYLAAGAALLLAVSAFLCRCEGERAPPRPGSPPASKPTTSPQVPSRERLDELCRELVAAPTAEAAPTRSPVGEPLAASAPLVVSGDAASLGILAEVRRDYAELAAIECSSEAPAAALAKVVEGVVDAAIVCAIEPPVLPPGLVRRSLGTFVAALTTSLSNPVRDVPRAQLRALLGGQVRDWRHLGGRDGGIQLAWVPGGPYRVLQLRSLGEERRMRARDEAALLARVAGDSSALGVVRLRALGGARVAVLTIDGVLPSRFAFEAGDYPLGYRVYLVHAARPRPCLESFLGYLASTRGHRLLQRQIDP